MWFYLDSRRENHLLCGGKSQANEISTLLRIRSKESESNTLSPILTLL